MLTLKKEMKRTPNPSTPVLTNREYTYRNLAHHVSGMYIYYWIAIAFLNIVHKNKLALEKKTVIPSSSNLGPHPTEKLEALFPELEAWSFSWKKPLIWKWMQRN